MSFNNESEFKNKFKTHINKNYNFEDYTDYKSDDEIFFCINNALYSLFPDDNNINFDIIFYDKSSIYQFPDALNIDEIREVKIINSMINEINIAYKYLFNLEFRNNISKLDDIITEIKHDGYYYFYSLEFKNVNNFLNIGIFIDSIFNAKDNKVLLSYRYYLDHQNFDTLQFNTLKELIEHLYKKYKN